MLPSDHAVHKQLLAHADPIHLCRGQHDTRVERADPETFSRLWGELELPATLVEAVRSSFNPNVWGSKPHALTTNSMSAELNGSAKRPFLVSCHDTLARAGDSLTFAELPQVSDRPSSDPSLANWYCPARECSKSSRTIWMPHSLETTVDTSDQVHQQLQIILHRLAVGLDAAFRLLIRWCCSSSSASEHSVTSTNLQYMIVCLREQTGRP